MLLNRKRYDQGQELCVIQRCNDNVPANIITSTFWLRRRATIT